VLELILVNGESGHIRPGVDVAQGPPPLSTAQHSKPIQPPDPQHKLSSRIVIDSGRPGGSIDIGRLDDILPCHIVVLARQAIFKQHQYIEISPMNDRICGGRYVDLVVDA